MKTKNSPANAQPKLICTVDVFARDSRVDVPLYEPAPGQSAEEAAKVLGFRTLGRKEIGDVVAAIELGSGNYARCVKL